MPTRSTQREECIHRQRRGLSHGLGADGELLKGSLLERLTVCQRPGCRCLKGEKHGPYLYVSVFDGRQSRQVYVPQRMQAQVRRWVKNYQRLSETVTKLSGLSVELIRLGHAQSTGQSTPRRQVKR
jgi:hypothetical protein